MQENNYPELIMTPSHKIDKWAELVSKKIYEGKQVIVFFDTETTGGVSGNTINVIEKNDHQYEGKRHRMLEFGASVTVFNEETGVCEPLLDEEGDCVRFHEYLNIWAEDPNKLRRINSMTEVPWGAYIVHGIDKDFLEGKKPLGHKIKGFEGGFKLPKPAPTMEQIIEPLSKVIGLSHVTRDEKLEKTIKCAAHNAEFDNKFMNSEFQLVGKSVFESYISPLCTLLLAKSVLPKSEVGGKYNLDSLSNYVKEQGLVQNEEIPRDLHGAMVDTRILLQIYNGITNSKFYKNAPNAPLSDKKQSEEIVNFLNVKQEELKVRRPLPIMKKRKVG